MIPFAAIVEQMDIGLMFVDGDGRILYCNAAEARLRGVPAEELVGRSVVDCHCPWNQPRVKEVLARLRSRPSTGLHRMRAGREQFVEQWFSPVFDAEGAFLGIILLSVDVTALESSRRKYETMATRDELTGLYNKNHFLTALARLREELGRDHPAAAVMVLDVNGMKTVNDTRGHEQGDRLLQAAGTVIRAAVRATDYVFRFGGDEFVVLMPGGDERTAASARRRIREGCHRWTAANPSLPLELGSGSAVARLPEELDQAFQLADEAMYRDKSRAKRGRNRLSPR